MVVSILLADPFHHSLPFSIPVHSQRDLPGDRAAALPEAESSHVTDPEENTFGPEGAEPL